MPADSRDMVDERISVVMEAMADFHVLGARVTVTQAKHILAKLDALSASPGAWRESFIAEEEEGPVVGILIDLPDGSQIWSGECSNALLEQAAEQEGSPADSGLFLMVAAKGKPTRPVAQVATVEDGIALARAVAACHAPAHPTPATPAVKGEVTDEWAERFCEAANWSPDGQECKTVEGQLRCVSFRDLAKGYILAAIATDPCTPATPAGWIVSNANGDRWRTWEGGFSAWTDDREKATRYARREDAEAVHAEDEDAWRIEPYGPATPAGEELREKVARIVCRIVRTYQNHEWPEGYTMDMEVENAWDDWLPEVDAILAALQPQAEGE